MLRKGVSRINALRARSARGCAAAKLVATPAPMLWPQIKTEVSPFGLWEICLIHCRAAAAGLPLDVQYPR